MELVSVPLDDGRIEPQFASHPSLDVGSRERANAFGDLLTERLSCEIEEQRRLRGFRGHDNRTDSIPHKTRGAWRCPLVDIIGRRIGSSRAIPGSRTCPPRLRESVVPRERRVVTLLK